MPIAHTFPIIVIAIILNAVGQLFLKAGTVQTGVISFHNLAELFFDILFNPMIFTGVMCYVVSLVLWVVALSRVDVGYAYPMLSLGYVITAVAAYFLFDEPLSMLRIAGIAVIIFGVFLISRTA